MVFFRFFFLLFIGCATLHLAAQQDLEEFTQDFFKDIKKITIPDYPHAFNPSIIRWKGQWLLSFRVVESGDEISSFCSASESAIGLVWLDDQFDPLGKAQLIFLDHPQKRRAKLIAEDARLIAVEDHIYLIYSANKEEQIENGGFRMYAAKLDAGEKGFFVVHNECLSTFEGADADKREKNWVPFIYEEQLLLAYTLCPHKILKPLLNGTEVCESVASSVPSLIWEWGELRGGTPGVRLNDEYYLSFFHSSIFLNTVHSSDKCIPHYFLGAYLFSSTPPFEIQYISPEPIVGENFYQGITYEPYWHPVCVVFPCGLAIEGNDVWISYGRQDHEMWIAQLEKQKLLDSLIHVSTLKD